ncbi:MAG: hypothetical protein V1848_03460, partial [Candidatus Magasanikbacteria bacterium]
IFGFIIFKNENPSFTISLFLSGPKVNKKTLPQGYGNKQITKVLEVHGEYYAFVRNPDAGLVFAASLGHGSPNHGEAGMLRWDEDKNQWFPFLSYAPTSNCNIEDGQPHTSVCNSKDLFFGITNPPEDFFYKTDENTKMSGFYLTLREKEVERIFFSPNPDTTPWKLTACYTYSEDKTRINIPLDSKECRTFTITMVRSS